MQPENLEQKARTVANVKKKGTQLSFLGFLRMKREASEPNILRLEVQMGAPGSEALINLCFF